MNIHGRTTDPSNGREVGASTGSHCCWAPGSPHLAMGQCSLLPLRPLDEVAHNSPRMKAVLPLPHTQHAECQNSLHPAGLSVATWDSLEATRAQVRGRKHTWGPILHPRQPSQTVSQLGTAQKYLVIIPKAIQASCHQRKIIL